MAILYFLLYFTVHFKHISPNWMLYLQEELSHAMAYHLRHGRLCLPHVGPGYAWHGGESLGWIPTSSIFCMQIINQPKNS
jgi:hypothetical protein